MDKNKLIKIIVCGVIGIMAIIYFINNQSNADYDDISVENIVVEEKKENIIENEKSSKIKVYITGEVVNPSVLELNEGDRIEDAIEKANGITIKANLNDVNLAYEVSDGEKIYIPSINEVEEESDLNIGNGELTKITNNKVNINKAIESDLTTISGIGQSTAEKIIAYREKNGKFKNIEDIKNVSGIGDSKYEKIKDFISVK